MRRLAALALACALFSAPMPAVAAAGLDPSAVAYCFDTERDLVQRVRVRHCKGRIVSEREAAIEHARIEKYRLARRTRGIRRDLTRQAQGLEFHSAGAAFAVNRQGHLLTSAHVIRGCSVLEARSDSAAPIRARVKAVSEKLDLAVVAVGQRPSTIISFAASSPPDGDPLALIGFPAEGMIRLKPSMTPVLISHAISDPVKFGLVGVAGDVRRGNSGGPALDGRGRAVGVLKAKVDSVAALRLTGRSLDNLGVIVDTPRVLAFLKATRTPHAIAGPDAPELSGRDLFERSRGAVYRIDCYKRS